MADLSMWSSLTLVPIMVHCQVTLIYPVMPTSLSQEVELLEASCYGLLDTAILLTNSGTNVNVATRVSTYFLLYVIVGDCSPLGVPALALSIRVHPICIFTRC